MAVWVCFPLGSVWVPLKIDPEVRIRGKPFTGEVISGLTMKELGKGARECRDK